MDIYLIFVFLLFALAITDLIVGVSNDAVNFLNSAIGSRVAPKNVIMIVASLGILAGALFSNGMMEVARKGIFHPQHFYFSEIMVIFMAVMITDILLLDFFNTIGMPTSTTVSIVFEILGAAVAVSVIKLHAGEQTILVDGVERIATMNDYINSGTALKIISGILLSVVISFTVGALVQWVSRLVFSFNYGKPYKYFGAIWGGIAITAITYFILIKGAKNASFMSKETKTLIVENSKNIIWMSFVFWTIFSQLLKWIFKTNILKVVVLTGTFALAMAFAGNDLVNFIGVPLAGYEAFNQAGGEDILMSGLAKKVHTPTEFLVIAGVVMVLTLWLSRKARSVTETELNLSRQDEGSERFGSSLIARVIVRKAVETDTFFSKIIPDRGIEWMKSRFDKTQVHKKIQKQENPPMFDLIRASVNLTVASILIAFATSLKLPLSTTYVTFMVAMGTSLADGAWGRDSAVYRVTGVFAVIGGWFLTAMIAFTVAFVIALFINWGSVYAVAVLVVFAVFAIVKTTRSHKKKQIEKELDSDEYHAVDDSIEKVLQKCNKSVKSVYDVSSVIIVKAIEYFVSEDHKQMRQLFSELKEFNLKVKKNKDRLPTTINLLKEGSIETGHHFVQVIDHQRAMMHALRHIVEPSYEYIANKHKPISEMQQLELTGKAEQIASFIKYVSKLVADKNYSELPNVLDKQNELIVGLEFVRKSQIKRIKNNETGTKNSMLFLNIINEMKNIVLNTVNIFKAQRDFSSYTEKTK